MLYKSFLKQLVSEEWLERLRRDKGVYNAIFITCSSPLPLELYAIRSQAQGWVNHPVQF